MAAGRRGLDLVTGGAGFIGSHLTEGLLAAGRAVRVADDLSTGHARNLAGLDVELLEGDVADPGVAAAACAGAERVFHVAARPSVPWSFEQPEAARRANLETTLAVLAAAQSAGARRIVFSSSSAIYGDSPDLPKHEDMEPAPLSPYAAHKLEGEQALAAATGVESVSLRYFNVYGPRQDPSSPYSGVIALFARWARAGERARVYGDGGQTRDFIFVRDVVAANLAAGEVELPGRHAIVNVAGGRRVSVLELWARVCEAAGVEPTEPEFLPPREGDVRHSEADVRRMHGLLGVRAEVGLADGLRATLAAD